MKKQMKITHSFATAQANNVNDAAQNENLRKLMEDNKKLKKILMEKETYAFQLQRNLLPQPRLFQAKHQHAINNEISALGGEVIMRSRLAKQKDKLETYLRLFGIQVKSYTNEKCVVKYNVRVKGKLMAQYGIQFSKPPSGSNWSVYKYHLPLGLSLAILSDYQPMSLEYLRQLQVALNAYHNREVQISQLMDEIPSHVFVSRNMSGTFVELVFPMMEKGDTVLPIKTALELKYDAFEIRPKGLKIFQNLVTNYNDEFEVALSNQFEKMKYLSLPKAFAEVVNKDSEYMFYCPTEEELENLETPEIETEQIQFNQNQNNLNERRNRYHDDYEDENIQTHSSEKASKKNCKNSTKKTQQKNRQQQENIEDLGSVSDDESVSFNTLRHDMQKNKLTSKDLAFKVPSSLRAGSKRNLPQSRSDQGDDDGESNTTNVLRDGSLRRQNMTDVRISSYQVTDTDLTTGSYVFIPESKKKTTKKSTAKKGSGNKSYNKENTKKNKGKAK